VGQFNLSDAAERWKPFRSQQQVTTEPPGFVWDASVRLLPGLAVRVHDAYVAGEGILYAALLGLFPVMSLRGRHEIAAGQLMRFLAEAAWYPTALLPSQTVDWTAVDSRSARVTLRDGAVAVSMRFRFNEEDLIEEVQADARGRTVGKQVTPTPWRGRLWNYQQHAGMLVPLEGEVAWLLPEGAKPYWRGRITKLEYQFAK
jgi:hypothetical protein